MWGNGSRRAFQALRCGFESRHSLQRWSGGTNGHVAQSGRGNRSRACSVAVRVRPWSPSARGAIGRRGTLRPCRSGFESPRADHSPAWRKRLTPPAQNRCTCGFESHRWDHPEGDIVEGKDTALSARQYGFESRCPRQDGLVSRRPRQVRVAEGRDGDLGGLISLGMRVRFPPPLPTAGSFNGRTAVLQTAHGGSIPSPATRSVVSEGKRCAARL
jgi:hypothetical protein